MKAYLLLLTLFCFQTTFGQFAIIADKDSFANVRKSGEIGSVVIDTLTNGQIVFCLEDMKGWRPVDYEKNGMELSGYVHNSRLFYIDNFKSIKYSILTKKSITFIHDSISLTIIKEPFIANKNKLQYEKTGDKTNESTFLAKINGKQMWGTDGEIPKYQYQKILLKIGNKDINLPCRNMYEPTLDYTKVNIDSKTNTIYITADNSDGAGAYTVLWIVTNGIFKRKIIAIPF
jgi:hypothetical protein